MTSFVRALFFPFFKFLKNVNILSLKIVSGAQFWGNNLLSHISVLPDFQKVKSAFLNNVSAVSLIFILQIELVPLNNLLVPIVNEKWSWKEIIQDFIETKSMIKICWIVFAIFFLLFIVLPYVLPYLLQDVEPEASYELIRKLDRLLPPKWQHYQK